MNDQDPDLEKIGLDCSNDKSLFSESDSSDDEKEAKNNKQHKQLFLDLGKM